MQIFLVSALYIVAFSSPVRADHPFRGSDGGGSNMVRSVPDITYSIPNVVYSAPGIDTTRSTLSGLLDGYYAVKNALVKDDAASASKNAAVLLKAIGDVDPKKLTAAGKKAFAAVKDKLSYDARHISEVQHIAHQREHFTSLSMNMYQLAKAVKLSGQPVYKDYCPMKKAYWLSSDAAIKNPYFGNAMPTCGSIEETIK
jgi:hypothetical protein